jgi:hypothetical protein
MADGKEYPKIPLAMISQPITKCYVESAQCDKKLMNTLGT